MIFNHTILYFYFCIKQYYEAYKKTNNSETIGFRNHPFNYKLP